MRFTIAITSLIALANGAALSRRQADPHQIDFRSWGGDDCVADNQGIYTLTFSDIGVCRPFPDTIGSLKVYDVDNPDCYRKTPLLSVANAKTDSCS